MATATGIWSPPPPEPLLREPERSKSRSPESRKQRNHHYTFDLDDNGLDINGFVVHTAKPSHPRQKFRVFLDSNENGRFDKKDQLIGRIGLKEKHAAKGVGNLLDEDEFGQLDVNFKKARSNSSMRLIDDSDIQTNMSSPTARTNEIPLIIGMSFSDTDGSNVGDPVPLPGIW